MAWINLTAPAAGDPTEVDLAEDIVNNLTFLYNQFLSAVGNREIVLNGSFESDADADSYPDGWDRTLYANGSFTYRNSISISDDLAYHGKRSISFTSIGGASNGGGYATSAEYIEVTEGRPYKIQFSIKSSVADIHNKVSILWYDCTKTIISTQTVYENSSTNPTTWTIISSVVTPPNEARYCKIRLHAAIDDDVTAGTCYFDDVRLNGYVPSFENSVEFRTAGTWDWKCPSGINWCAVTVCGGGGGGSGGVIASTLGGGGGGAGGLSFMIQNLTSGTRYVLTVGAGGAGGAADANGVDGGDSSFIGTSTLSALKGLKGLVSGGVGGAGGTATGGTLNVSGETGATRVAGLGGDGGAVTSIGAFGCGVSVGDGRAAYGYGGGGGGGSQADNGGAGGVGFVVINW